MEDQRGKERRWFLAAVALFAVWLATLGAMAAFSGTKPNTPADSPAIR